MIELAKHLLGPMVDHPDDLSLQQIDTEDVTILEAVAHPDDRERLEGDGGRTLRAIRNILSAAAGRHKATLDFVDAHGEASEE